MAGADRVEGCLFGNGERTGNVCLVTLALNLYSQGVHPGLDFSQIDKVRQLVESCTNLPVHPRHPYAGELVFTAFSGSHQDAIKKGFAAQDGSGVWNIPYLPVDPADLGRSYDAVVRVNSQSGKGGVSFLLQQQAGFELPRRLQIEFSKQVQKVSDETSKEINSAEIYRLFDEAYLQVNAPYQFKASKVSDDTEENVTAEITLQHGEQQFTVTGRGNGPVDAAASAISEHFGNNITVVDYHEHGVGAGSDATAVCYVEIKVANGSPLFGVGQDKNISRAAIKALLNGVNRSVQH